MKMRNPDSGWTGWLTPGGGIDPGESTAQALRRELEEELSLTSFEPGPLVWHREDTFSWNGVLLNQHESFFLVRLPRFDPLYRTGFGPVEDQAFLELRWWPLVAIAASNEVFVPRRLAALLHDIIERGPPDPPIDCGI